MFIDTFASHVLCTNNSKSLSHQSRECTALKDRSFSSTVKGFTCTNAGEQQFPQITAQEKKGRGLFSPKGTYKKS